MDAITWNDIGRAVIAVAAVNLAMAAPSIRKTSGSVAYSVVLGVAFLLIALHSSLREMPATRVHIDIPNCHVDADYGPTVPNNP